MQKLTSQHRNLQRLIGFAHSPRLHATLQCQLSITTVTPQPKRRVALPQTEKQWEKIIRTIVPSHLSLRGKWVEKEAKCASNMLANTEATLHCECSLIQHFVQTSRLARRRSGNPISEKRAKGQPSRQHGLNGELDAVGRASITTSPEAITDRSHDIPPFSYIGLSQPTCSPCQIWIEGYNDRGGPIFYTRRSNRKWDWPWALPRLEEPVLSRYMVDHITTTYYNHCEAKGRLRKSWDLGNRAMTYI